VRIGSVEAEALLGWAGQRRTDGDIVEGIDLPNAVFLGKHHLQPGVHAVIGAQNDAGRDRYSLRENGVDVRHGNVWPHEANDAEREFVMTPLVDGCEDALVLLEERLEPIGLHANDVGETAVAGEVRGEGFGVAARFQASCSSCTMARMAALSSFCWAWAGRGSRADRNTIEERRVAFMEPLVCAWLVGG
jgi:hypothetical protein